MKLTVSVNADGILKLLAEEDRKVINAMKKAHSKVASEAVRVLKRGLSWRAGRDSSSPNYQNSPKGSLPYMHTGGLRKSIGMKVKAYGNKVESEVGSGAKGLEIEYAKYLEGHNGTGIRPFLDYIDGYYNEKILIDTFKDTYKPLEGGK